tara:strand:+ start:1712 stop:3577 length:1866 start_codon:yes stop_codon:yes gene_type:complete
MHYSSILQLKHLTSAKFFTLITLAVCFGLIQLAFHEPTTYRKKLADRYADELADAIYSLNQQAKDFKAGRVKPDAMRTKVASTRLAYKKVEFLLEYYYPGYVEEHINGAPLLHVEKNEAGAYILPAEGLQVLDEIAHSEDLKQNRAELSDLTQKLINQYKLLHDGFKEKQIKEVELIEACRLELVRIFTLGVTGFDTPGSLNALEEAQVSFQTMYEFLKPALNPQQSQEILPYFNKASDFLTKNNDFDSFDRLGFLRDIIDPLYAKLLIIQQQTEDNRLFSKPSGWNAQSEHIFSDNFLNPYFYTQLREEKDSKQLHDLGKKLFFDASISSEGKLSCSSCHNPNLAYTDGRAKSLSFVEGKTVERNAPTLVNAVYADRYFYDLRAFSLEQQAEHVIFNHMEFNTAYSEILEKLNQKEHYQKLFKATFGHKTINREEFSNALASYVLSLRSYNSPFDKYIRGDSESIDPEIKKGFNIFMGKANCGTCHFAPTFAGLVPPLYSKNESEILGVLKDPNAKKPTLDDDIGRLGNNIQSESGWIYERSFKTTTVRNVELSGPYFHNGAYSSLEEVVEFYNNGGGAGIGLEVKNQTLGADSLHLTDAESKALIAFMKSLTDNPWGKY